MWLLDWLFSLGAPKPRETAHHTDDDEDEEDDEEEEEWGRFLS